ncbi:MAG: hypothetical protein MPK62_00090 [Alphaproteobacteria bacterium]|nr:hypothetical protein [Alphaproteobacteria bacterium]
MPHGIKPARYRANFARDMLGHRVDLKDHLIRLIRSRVHDARDFEFFTGILMDGGGPPALIPALYFVTIWEIDQKTLEGLRVELGLARKYYKGRLPLSGGVLHGNYFHIVDE